MLEFVHDFLDFIATVDFDLEVVARVGEVRGDDEELFVDIIERNCYFKLLVRPFTVLFVLTHGDRHLSHVMRLVGKLDYIGRLALLGSTRALLLSKLVVLARVEAA